MEDLASSGASLSGQESFGEWYLSEAGAARCNDVAQELFEEAIKVFNSQLSKDKTKAQWIAESRTGTIDEVLNLVFKAQVQYKTEHGDSAIRRGLSDLASKVHYYGDIMDVLIQQHPEYVSLVWGAMKFLLVGVINHKELLSTLSNSFCMIADSLPRIELAVKLYPTKQIKSAVVNVYAYILRYLIRALRWYQESRLSHALHAITRPSKLRFDDLVKKISSTTQNVDALAKAGSRAEQRDMHTEQQVMQQRIDDLTKLVVELKETIVTHHNIVTSTQIEFRETLSDIQLSLFLNSISPAEVLDPIKRFQSALLMRNMRRRKASNDPAFWMNSRMNTWNHSASSSLIIVRGVFKNKSCIRDFCTNCIESLRNGGTATLWILSTIDDQNRKTAQISTIDLLKSLVSQAIKLNTSIHTDASLSVPLTAYKKASSESDWLNLLGSVIQGLPLIYIFIDVEIIAYSQLAEFSEGFSWPREFLKLFSALSERGTRTILKVVLVSYGSPVFREALGNEFHNLVVSVDNTGRSAGRRRVRPVLTSVTRRGRFGRR